MDAIGVRIPDCFAPLAITARGGRVRIKNKNAIEKKEVGFGKPTLLFTYGVGVGDGVGDGVGVNVGVGVIVGVGVGVGVGMITPVASSISNRSHAKKRLISTSMMASLAALICSSGEVPD